MKITICSSASFYKEIFPIKKKLEELGFEVLIPVSAEEMQESGDFDVQHSKTWLTNPEDFDKKTFYIKHHLKKIDEGDAILVVNLEKKGIKGYIGGNVLLEMFYGWINKKPLYLLHPVTDESPLYEEVMGMGSVCLEGDLSKLTGQ